MQPLTVLDPGLERVGKWRSKRQGYKPALARLWVYIVLPSVFANP